MAKERFRITICFDVWGEDIEEGKKEAESIVKVLNHNYDCNSNMETIFPCKFGDIDNQN